MKLIKAFCLLILLALSMTCCALQLEGIRAYSNNDKTRIVFDLDAQAQYSTALSKDSTVFVIRIKNVDNYQTSPNSVPLSANSPISQVKKVIDGRDVRYLFSYVGSSTPEVFALKPQQGNASYRIVLDFPHTATATTRNNNLANSGESRSEPHTNATLQSQEQALFLAYSSVGSDGLRTMTPAQVKEYNQKLVELRQRYAASVAAAQAEKQNLNNNKPQSPVEEATAPPQPVPAKTIDKPFIIAVDAGHGGKDPGAIGKKGVQEKKVTLAIAKALADYINSNKAFKAVLIRSSDKYIGLDTRSELARKNKADILISIHADSVASQSASARGVSVWVLSNNRAQRENQKVLNSNKSTSLIGGAGEVISDSNAQNPYLAATILDMSSSNSRDEGYLLGNEILGALSKFTRIRKTSPIHASLAVLKAPDIPSLLIETGFLSNANEEKQLAQANYQKQIAYHIYQGIESYYKKYPAQKLQSRIDSARRANAGKTITVQKGDTLGAIAKRYGTTVVALKKTNSLSSDNLKIGQKLVLPK